MTTLRSLVRLTALLVAGIGLARAQGSSTPTDATTQALAIQVEALAEAELPEVRGARIAWPTQIHEFYVRRSFALAWSKEDTALQLLRAIEDSRLEGLDPADYHEPLLQRLRSEAASPAASEVTRVQLDLVQTDALLRLAYHLALGKVDPRSFDPQWNYNRTLEHVDVTHEIEATLAAQDVYERIQALKPTHRLYVVLREELVRYRAIEAAGGWATIPAGPTLRPSARDPRVPALRERLTATGDLEPGLAAGPDDVYDPALQAAVQRYQSRMGLDTDGAVGPRTLDELNVSVADRIRQLRVNLDRGRVLLHDLPSRFVVVNIAGYQVYLVEGGQVVWSARAQVGKPYRRTPSFRSEISYLVFNPTWTVPPTILRKDILPEARRDPSSITRRGLKVLDGSGREVDPEQIDWSHFASGNIPYTLRQDPGPKNALGRVKFIFPNDYLVYLHDTPSVGLFDEPDRSFSSGCVRVERPLELAARLLNDPERFSPQAIDQVIASQRLQNVRLPERVPVLLAYWTAWVDDESKVNFRRDVYGQDARWAAGLEEDFTVRERPRVADR